jgi:GNAT superfamily N-acetyltransferase
MTSSLQITLREATDDDEPFLRQVYASTRADELAQVPWNAEQREAFLKMQFEAQHTYYHAQYPDANYHLICVGDERIGRLYTLRQDDEIRIMDITVMPERRNQGIGKRLVQDLVDEGNQSGKPVRIWVEYFNPSMTLFQRMGFSKVQEDGFNYLLEYRKPGSSKQPA